MFFARFMLAAGLLVGMTVGRAALAGPEGSGGTPAAARSAPEASATPAATRSAGEVAATPAAAPEPAAAPTSTPAAAIASGAAPAAPLTGPQVYNTVCIACHAPPGVGGAPAFGDSDAWAPRIAQGMDTLIDHALHGFSGSTGVMPRKGERADLSDEEIIGAVKYMVSQATR